MNVRPLSSIKDPRIRNLLRGLLDKSTPDDARATFDHLRSIPGGPQSKAVFEQILFNPLFKHLPLPEAFPKNPVPGTAYFRPAVMSVEKEVAYQLARIERERPRLVDFLAHLAELNAALLNLDAPRIEMKFNEIIEKHGFSNILARKLGYISGCLADRYANLKDLSASIEATFNAKRRDVLLLAALDFCDPTYEFDSVRTSLDALITKRRLSETTTAIVKFYFEPYATQGNIVSERLLSLSMISLPDALFYICMLMSNTNMFHGGVISGELRAAMGPELIAGWDHLRQLKDVSLLSHPDVGTEIGDETYYRQTLAFLELDDIAKYRSLVDTILYNGHPTDASTNYIPKDIDLNAIAVAPVAFDQQLDVFRTETAGLLTRTLAFIVLARRKHKSSSISDAQKLILLDRTKNIARFLEVGELHEFFVRPSMTKIDTYLYRALCFDKTQKNVDQHALRKIVQDIVIAEHGGDIVAFARRLADTGAQIAAHFFMMCSEMFLVQLFHLFPHSSDVVSAKANLLEWFGETYDEPAHVDRAKALRLDMKLKKVRGDIEDTRLYVDPVRYQLWLQDSGQDEMQRIARMEGETDLDLTQFQKANDPVEVLRRPYLRLTAVLQSAFTEFCQNKFFGVDSYIGRRIRHGTLDGVMVTDVRKIIDDSGHAALLQQPAIHGYVTGWIDAYERSIETIGNEWFQIRSPKKPKGAFDTNLLAENKIQTSITFVTDVMKWLREVDTPATVLSLTYEYCWVLLEKDLLELRSNLAKLYSQIGVIDTDHLLAIAYPDSRAQVMSFAGNINSLTAAKFKSLSDWFTRPKNLLPSASVGLLIEAVIAEVSEYFPQFKPRVEVICGEVDIYGNLYHSLYDILYIMVGNAAEHAEPTGRLLIRADATSGTVPDNVTDALLSISVVSDIKACDAIADVSQSLEDAMSRNISEALAGKRKSGIARMRALSEEKEAITDLVYSVDGTTVMAGASLRLKAG